MSGTEQVEKVEDYIKHRWTYQRNPHVYEYVPEQIPEETKELASQMNLTESFANRAIWDPTKPAGQELGTARELLQEYPPQKGYSWVPVGRTSGIPNQELALAKQVEIKDKEGNWQGTYWVAGSNEERQAASFDNQLSTALLGSGFPVTIRGNVILAL